MKKRVGIIGAGQLGAFLCSAANELDIETTALSHSTAVPAATVAGKLICAAYDDASAVESLMACSDCVTFEFEDIPDTTLDQLELAAANGQVEVFPYPKTIRLLKNKADQKAWLKAEGFPTSPFEVCERANYDELAQRYGQKFVQKSLTGGIDGRGVQVVSEDNRADIWADQTVLVEAFVPHSKELAVLVARSKNGASEVYPVVEMAFAAEANVLTLASAPAELSSSISAEARALGAEIVERLDGVGVFAIELFLQSDGQLLVNEISPRVHNSGHLSMEANETCQYQQHLKAILGEPLGDVAQKAPAAMVNLLYHDGLSRLVPLPFSAWQVADSATAHWYGKSEGRPGRKMGHITAIGSTLDEASDRANKAKRAMANDSESVA